MKIKLKKSPNLFDYATSELSQDAFINWLIKWADKDYKEVDRSLNACAICFVQQLLGKGDSITIETIEAGRQWNNIDVWVLINNKYFIVIEDKKGSKEHSNQLNRYSEIAKKHYEKTDIEVILVYFKMEEQGKYQNITDAGFSVFQRKEMLSILKNYIGSTENKNNILVDYFENLKNLDEKINSYLTTPIENWHSRYTWQGFYSELQNEIEGNWDYVSNPSGGFLGFNWNWKHSIIEGREFDYYLQLEQGKLVFKLVAYKEDERRELRDFYQKKLYNKAKALNVEISQYGRLGKFMGVAKLNSEYRVTNEKGLLNFSETVENLKCIMKLIDETKKEIG